MKSSYALKLCMPLTDMQVTNEYSNVSNRQNLGLATSNAVNQVMHLPNKQMEYTVLDYIDKSHIY